MVTRGFASGTTRCTASVARVWSSVCDACVTVNCEPPRELDAELEAAAERGHDERDDTRTAAMTNQSLRRADEVDTSACPCRGRCRTCEKLAIRSPFLFGVGRRRWCSASSRLRSAMVCRFARFAARRPVLGRLRARPARGTAHDRGRRRRGPRGRARRAGGRSPKNSGAASSCITGCVNRMTMRTSTTVVRPSVNAKPSHVADGEDVEHDRGEEVDRLRGVDRAHRALPAGLDGTGQRTCRRAARLGFARSRR